jgi:hypothetical protein
VVDETRVRPIAEKWLKQHPDANIREAYSAIDSEVLGALKAFHHKHPELDWKHQGIPREGKHSFVSLLCVGYDMGVPVDFVSDYAAPVMGAGEFTKDPTEYPLRTGFFGPFGVEIVSREILKETSTQLVKYRNIPAVKKYRTANAANKTADLSTDDFIALSKACLEATESQAGRLFDKDANLVAPPNHYAIIDPKQGFRWVK